jgi:hypothetical protein
MSNPDRSCTSLHRTARASGKPLGGWSPDQKLSINGLRRSWPDEYREVGLWEVTSELGINHGRTTGKPEVIPADPGRDDTPGMSSRERQIHGWQVFEAEIPPNGAIPSEN